jgi:hypothetical protein
MMTQIAPAEIVRAAAGRTAMFSPEVLVALLLAFLAGALFGALTARKKMKP